VAQRSVRIGPSILAADFLRLGEQMADAEAAGADFFHVDVMDGRFVPNLAIGLAVMEAVRRGTALPIDVHLMVAEPGEWIGPFAAAGADSITVHVEAGAAPGVTLNPATPLVMLEECLPIVRQVLLMTVNPGFGGQTFIPASLERIRRVRAMLDVSNPGCALEVDGGIKASNLGRVVEAGADTIVAGSSLFTPGTPLAETMAALRAAVAEAQPV